MLATLDYLAQAKMPTLAFAGAEDVTQRKGNAYLTRTSYTSAQCLYPLADYLHTEMKMKTAATIADDFAFGYEQIGGFQRVLEGEGGRVVKKLWSPLNTADYGKDARIGHYAACFYIDGMVIEAALKKTGGKSDDPDAFVKAIRSVAETPRGPISFDDHGNVVIDLYVRRVDKDGGKIVNRTVKTYHKVSRFWTMDPKAFLKEPVFSRDFPPMKG